MVARPLHVIDSASLTVTSSATQSIGDSVINNSDSPDGTRYVFNSGFSTQEVTIDDTSGSADTLEDDAPGGHTVLDGAGLVTNGNGVEAESIILLQELDSGGTPTGPIITLVVFSQNGVTGDVWGYASDTPLIPGTQYEKVGGSNTGSADYADFTDSWLVSVDGTAGDDAMGIGYTDGDGDEIDGSDGNDDYIFGNAGADTINAGAGNDYVEGGDDADLFQVTDGFGSDTIVGGEGGANDDTLDFSGLSSGVDVTFTGDKAGTASSGADDITFSEIENVTLTGQADSVDASADSAGVDIDAGAGADTIIGGDGDDRVRGRGGSDSITGGAGNDTLNAGGGADTIDGGDGADTLRGGGGNDDITVDQGDRALGGNGDDFFRLVDLDATGTGNAAITIIGGEDGETDGDTLQLTPDVGFDDITFTNTDDTAGGLSGTFTMADGTVVTFSEIENIICFTPGARILTETGERPVETLTVGDRVVTRDHGLQPLRWIGRRIVPGLGKFAPVLITPDALDRARRPLLVSPQHRMLFSGYKAQLYFGEEEVLVAAKHLIDSAHVYRAPCKAVTYIHLMFDRHEVIYAEGAATESFHAGDIGLSALADEARDELFSIFPELRSGSGTQGQTARPCLKRHEAQLLLPPAARAAA